MKKNIFSIQYPQKISWLLSIIINIVSLTYATGYVPARSLPLVDSASSVHVRVDEQQRGKTILNYKTPELRFEPVAHQMVRGKQVQRCNIGNMSYLRIPGEPEIPMIICRTIIAPGHRVKSVIIKPIDIDTVYTSNLLSYNEKPIPISSKNPTRINPNVSLYESDMFYPQKTHTMRGIQHRYGIGIAELDIYPVLYNPVKGEIQYFRNFTVTIETVSDGTEGTGVRVRLDWFKDGAITEENIEALQYYTDNSIRGSYENVLCKPSEHAHYLIITSQNIIDATTKPNVHDLIKLRKKQGNPSKVVPIKLIAQSYSGARLNDKLRNFIKDAYNNWKTRFVVLGGDVNIIPLRTVYAVVGATGDHIPTDLPYQCLDGSTWSEDFNAEVFIGRISAENPQEFSNQVHKIIGYEMLRANDPSLKQVLHLGEKLDAKTFASGSLVNIGSLYQSKLFIWRLYDQARVWSHTNVINEISSENFSLVDHLGHCNVTIVAKLYSGGNWWPESFTNKKFAFAKSQGCIPGAIDMDCIAEHQTTSSKTGMFAVVYNSRYGWYAIGNAAAGPSHHVHKSFWAGCYSHGLKYFGQLNEFSHRANTQQRWDILQSNLLGDPATPVRSVHQVPVIMNVVPKRGEKYYVSRKLPIRWLNSTAEGEHIHLYKNGKFIQNIAQLSGKTTNYEWVIPDSILPADDYSIRIQCLTINAWDTTDGTFTINPRPILSVNKPNGGEVWESGMTKKISWKDNINEDIIINLCQKNKVILKIAQVNKSAKEFTWHISDTVPVGNNYQIQITTPIEADKPGIQDLSDSLFSITGSIIKTLPYKQSFDSFTTKSTLLRKYWLQECQDTLDWTVWQGQTPSKLKDGITGPNTDFPTGKGNYLYVEASNPAFYNKSAHMVSPQFQIDSFKKVKLRFRSHMFSNNKGKDEMGNLIVDCKINGTWNNTMILLEKNRLDFWRDTSIIIACEQLQVRFRATIGPGEASDICIDDFEINGVPEIQGSDTLYAGVGDPIVQTLTIIDDDTANLYLRKVDLPSFLQLELTNTKNESLLKGVPSASDSGIHNLKFNICDQNLVVITQQQKYLHITNNHPPHFTSKPIKSTAINELYRYKISVYDENLMQPLKINAIKIPNWLNLDINAPRTAILSGTPDNNNLGSYDIDIEVTDNIIQHPIKQKYTLTVEKTGIKIPNTNIRPGHHLLTITPNPAKANNEYISFIYNGNSGDIASIQVFDALGTKILNIGPIRIVEKSTLLKNWNYKNTRNSRPATYIALLTVTTKFREKWMYKVPFGIQK